MEGVAKGNADLRVDILVHVPAGKSAKAAGDRGSRRRTRSGGEEASAADVERTRHGHVAGLGHSTDINAVMYPSYQAARCQLAQDDRNGIAQLY